LRDKSSEPETTPEIRTLEGVTGFNASEGERKAEKPRFQIKSQLLYQLSYRGNQEAWKTGNGQGFVNIRLRKVRAFRPMSSRDPTFDEPPAGNEGIQ